MNLLQFFKDSRNQLSMIRLVLFLSFINASVLSWRDPNDYALISLFLIPATTGKVGQKAVEEYFIEKDRKDGQT